MVVIYSHNLLRADHEKEYFVKPILCCARDIFGTETQGEGTETPNLCMES